jgi:hypothetical protein
MTHLSLAFYQRNISPVVTAYKSQTIHVGAMSSTVRRVALRSNEGHPDVPSSVVVKIIEPDWPDDPYGADRERWFYSRILPKLEIAHPHVYYSGLEPETQNRLVLLADLADRYRFPPNRHIWTKAEARCVLRAYAHLHVSGRDVLRDITDRSWLLPPYRQALQNEAIPAMADALIAKGIWGSLSGLDRLYNQVRQVVEARDGQRVTLLHNDLYPPNVALPHDLDQEAVIIDWGMLSWGMAELDLAYFFLQPFGASKRIERREALGWYWEARRALEGAPPPWSERLALQRLADAMLALALVPVAYQRACCPLPAGSPGSIYWKSMFTVLYEKLFSLCNAI